MRRALGEVVEDDDAELVVVPTQRPERQELGGGEIFAVATAVEELARLRPIVGARIVAGIGLMRNVIHVAVDLIELIQRIGAPRAVNEAILMGRRNLVFVALEYVGPLGEIAQIRRAHLVAAEQMRGVRGIDRGHGAK